MLPAIVVQKTAPKALDFAQIQSEYESKNPQQILKFAFDQFNNISISFGGAEDVVLIDMASKITKNFQVFSIDTGCLHSQTYQFLEQVRQHYNIKLEILFPDSKQVERLVKEKGLSSFCDDNHQECCGIRKVDSLRRKLAKVDAWITGQCKDRNTAAHPSSPIIQLDTAFSTKNHTIVKFNPLANWTSEQVWKYIRRFDIPYNPHQKFKQ